MVVNIVRHLQDLGYTEYEARIYSVLAETHPVSAYEAAKLAGVPTSKVYEVLAKLAAKGLVQEVGEPDRKLYIPLDPQAFLDQERRSHQQVLGTLEKEFLALRQPRQVSHLWSLDRTEDFFQKARGLLASAQESLLGSFWAEELPSVAVEWKEAVGRKLPSALVYFGDQIPQGLGQTYLHPIRDTLFQERGGRGFLLVADRKEVVWGTFTSRGVEGVWSRNPGFVTLAEDYVKHDIYIMKIVNRYAGNLEQRFGPGFSRLRDIYSDTEEGENHE